MVKAKRASGRSEAGLSRDRIVDVAIELLDAEGDIGLTFRALAHRLSTGTGAIYWYIENKNELLAAATDAVIVRAMGEVGHLRRTAKGAPQDRRRRLRGDRRASLVGRSALEQSLADGDAPDLRAGRAPGPSARSSSPRSVHRGDGAGELHHRREPPKRRQWPTRRTGPGPRRLSRDGGGPMGRSRRRRLSTFTRKVAVQLREHDDRAEFLAGIDLVVDGIETSL